MTPDNAQPQWLQVDLIDGPKGHRIIWNAAKVEHANIAYEEKAVPLGLTASQVDSATKELAAGAPKYRNPTVPTLADPRYSCQTFAEKLAAKPGVHR